MNNYKKWMPVLLICALVFGALGAVLYLKRSRTTTHVKKNRPKIVAEGEPQLVVQLGHSGGISSAAFSPDGRFIVSSGADFVERGSTDKAAILWETATGREIRRFVGHADSINAVTFSPDGHFILTGSGYQGGWRTELNSKDFTARLWDVTTGKEIRQFVGHKSAIISVAFSRNGRFILTGSHDKTVRLWNVDDGTEVRRFLGHQNYVSSVVFSPDDRFVLSGGGGTSRLWEMATGKKVRDFVGHKGEVTSVAFSPDGRFVLTGSPNPVPFSRDTIASLWDVDTGRVIRHFNGCSPIAFSPDGSQILTGVASEKKVGVQLWKANTGKEVRYFTEKDDTDSGDWVVKSVAFSPNGEFALIALGEEYHGGSSGGTYGEVSLRLYSIASGEEAQRFEGGLAGLADDLAFSSDGNFMLSGNGVWDVRTGNEIQFKGYNFDEWAYRSGDEPNITRRAFSKDGRFVLTPGTSDNYSNVQLWDTATGKAMFEVNMERYFYVLAVWFAPDNRFFFTFGRVEEGDNIWNVSCWKIATGKEVWHFSFKHWLWDKEEYRHHSRANTNCTLSPDGKLFAIRERDEKIDEKEGIILLDAHTGQVIRRLKVQVNSGILDVLEFSPNSRFLAIGGENWYSGSDKVMTSDFSMQLYDVITDKIVRKFQTEPGSETAVVFSPDGRFLLTGSGWDSEEKIVSLWDVKTGDPVQSFSDQLALQATFSPDSRFLLTIDYPGGKTAHLWETATGKEVRRFEGHTDSITSIAVSPDGRLVLTGSADHTERLWDISTGEEMCRLVSLPNGDWIVATPDGRFDTNSLEEIKGLHWIMSSDPLKPLPLEIFMRQYYEPRLLARVLAGEKFKPLPKLGELNRTQPEVKIVDIAPDSAETVQVTVEVANIKSSVQKDTEGKPLESGVFDVRLFRNGQLVGYAPADESEKESGSIWSWFTTTPANDDDNDGEMQLNADGKVTLKFPRIRWPRTGVEQVEFSAYAFNADRVKSATDRKTYAMKPKPAPIKGRAYLVRLGVNAYEREGLNLRYAANDARRVDDLAARLAARGEYEEVVSVPLISDYAVTLADGRSVAAQDATLQQVSEGRKRVTENSATKAHLRAVLDVLAGRQADAALLKQIPNADKLRAARPEDLALISVSSHGYTDSDGIFYLVPSDTGTAPLASPEFRSRCVSSDELSRWLRDVDAGELVMIVDACHSAAAIAGTDFKPGPMGSRGLGQLSYDKGMRILTATQADNVALEANLVRQGLLIYALLEDGLASWLADYKPRDKSILLTEWLGYGVERVPRLYEEMKGGRIRGTFDPRELENDKTQQPSLFDFARRRREVVLARQP